MGERIGVSRDLLITTLGPGPDLVLPPVGLEQPSRPRQRLSDLRVSQPAGWLAGR